MSSEFAEKLHFFYVSMQKQELSQYAYTLQLFELLSIYIQRREIDVDTIDIGIEQETPVTDLSHSDEVGYTVTLRFRKSFGV